MILRRNPVPILLPLRGGGMAEGGRRGAWMIRGFVCREGALHPVVLDPGDGATAPLPEDPVWIDLVQPTAQEASAIGAALGFEIPSIEAMREIEISSRLVRRGDVLFMTANIPADRGGWLENGPVTFILAPDRLLTLRYHAPRPFDTLPARIGRLGLGCAAPATVLVALFEAVVDDLADMVEEVGRRIERLSHAVFAANGEDPGGGEARALDDVLGAIGRADDALSKLRESLATFGRVAGFLVRQPDRGTLDAALERRMQTVSEDVRSLVDHTAFLAGKITFLLDATMGLINIEQNAIIKIFSVVAVVFLPPTLIASIYGMNFRHMPELDWPWGYPLALGAMVLSAILPWLYFRWRGWM